MVQKKGKKRIEKEKKKETKKYSTSIVCKQSGSM